MALLENSTNNYYKIDFDNCSVRGRQVYVKFRTYENETDRNKEKERAGKWAEFFQQIRETLKGLYDSLIADIESKGLKPEDILSPTEENKIDVERFPELRAKQDEMNALEPFEALIPNALYSYGGEQMKVNIPEEIEEKLVALGYEKEWLTDPVKITAGAEICVGEYNNEPIDHELFYERLKTVMGAVTDC